MNIRSCRAASAPGFRQRPSDHFRFLSEAQPFRPDRWSQPALKHNSLESRTGNLDCRRLHAARSGFDLCWVRPPAWPCTSAALTRRNAATCEPGTTQLASAADSASSPDAAATTADDAQAYARDDHVRRIRTTAQSGNEEADGQFRQRGQQAPQVDAEARQWFGSKAFFGWCDVQDLCSGERAYSAHQRK